MWHPTPPPADKPAVTVGGKTVEAHALEYSLGTGPDGVSGPLLVVSTGNGQGCAPSDYDNLPVQGAVVLLERGSCPFVPRHGQKILLRAHCSGKDLSCDKNLGNGSCCDEIISEESQQRLSEQQQWQR